MQNKNVLTLLKNVVADGSGDPIVLIQPGDKLIEIHGTFGSGTVTIEVKVSDGVWVPLENGTFTEPQARLFRGFPRSACIRATLVGATGPSLNGTITA